jgi:hypothetical protein
MFLDLALCIDCSAAVMGQGKSKIESTGETEE